MPPRTFGLAPANLTIEHYKAAFDAKLDEAAQSRLYDNRITITTYATSANPQWAAEAQAFIIWRDAALTSMFSQLEDFQTGGDQPSIDAFIDALPAIVWPDVISND